MAISKERLIQMNKDAANAYYLNLIKGQDKSGVAYFVRERQLTPQTLKSYGLGYAPNSDWTFLIRELQKKGYSKEEMIEGCLARVSEKNGKMYDYFHNRVMFPIVDTKGDVIGFGGRVLDDSTPKYLNTGVTVAFDKGSNLFSLNNARDSKADALVLCEGYMDVIAMNQAGFTEAIATLGTAITANQARLISLYADEVIISYDNDEAGAKAKRKAIELLSDAGVKTRVLNMDGAKDPDEYIKKFGKEAFQKLLDNAEPSFDYTLRICEQTMNMNYETSRQELAERICKPLSMLPPVEKTAAMEYLKQKYDIEFDMNREQAIANLPPLDAETMEQVCPSNEYRKMAQRMPDTPIHQCGLPEWMSDAFGMSGFPTIGEAMSLSFDELKIVFEGDMEILRDVCDTFGMPFGETHGGLDE